MSVDTASLEQPGLARAGGARVVARVDDEVGEAFSAYAARRGPALVRLARGVLRDPYQAEDVVQDVLARVLLQWSRVSAAEDMDAYVHRMVVNACTSFFRRASRRREFAHGPDTLPDRGSADPTAAVDEADRLVGLLRRLPAKQRAVLVLRHYENLPDVRIAAILGTTEVTVRTNAHRGLAALRRLVEADDAAQGGGAASAKDRSKGRADGTQSGTGERR